MSTKLPRAKETLFPTEEFIDAKEVKSPSGFMSHEPAQAVHHTGLRKLEDFSARMMASQMEGYFPDDLADNDKDLTRMAKLSVKAAKALLAELDAEESSGQS